MHSNNFKDITMRVPFSFLKVCHATSSQRITKTLCRLFIPASRNHLILCCWTKYMYVTETSGHHVAQSTGDSDNPALFTVSRTRSSPWWVCHCRWKGKQSTSSWLLKNQSLRISVAHHRWNSSQEKDHHFFQHGLSVQFSFVASPQFLPHKPVSCTYIRE